jgi:hypothetical protein
MKPTNGHIAAAVACLVLSLADAEAVAQNLLQNPDFKTDTLSWTAAGGAALLAYVGSDGDPSRGCAELSDITGFGASLVQCVNLGPSPAPEYAVAVSFKPIGFSPTVDETGVLLIWYGDSSCFGGEVGTDGRSAGAGVPADSWARLECLGDGAGCDPVATPDGAVSVAFAAGTGSEPTNVDPRTLRFDSTYFAPAPIFADGFENGSTSRWSDALPH